MIFLIAFVFAFISITTGKAFHAIYSDKIEIVERENINLPIVREEQDNNIVLPEIEEVIAKEEELIKEDKIYKEEQKKKDIINILLVGMDAREGERSSRSDTIILLSYDKENHSIKMISFLRDTWVYLPERGWSKINAATAYGGTGLLINTLNENFDLDIQNYIQVKFNDFKQIIDMLGGVDINLTEAEIKYINSKLHTDDNDWNNDITASAGMVHLNGVQTLWHCRNRTIGSGDFSRTDRQKEVLKLLIDKAMNMSVFQVSSFAYEIKDYVNTNMPITTLIEIAEDALVSKNLKIQSYSVPFEGLYQYANKNGASVLEIDMEKTIEELHCVLGLTEKEN